MKRIALTLLVASAVMAGESARPGWLGFGYTYHRDAKQQWLLVKKIAPNSPASRAGLAVGDVITKIDGKPLHFRDDFAMLEFLGRIRPAQRVVFSVIHEQKVKNVAVTAVEMSDDYFRRWQLNLDIARQKRDE